MTYHPAWINSHDHTLIYVHLWKPEPSVTPRKLLLISHGMMEHALRYANFAHLLNQHGIVVMAPDQRGHGETAKASQTLGHLDPYFGWNPLIQDLNSCLDVLNKEFPSLPVWVLGHSMGSYLAQRFVIETAHPVQGLILSGTAHESPWVTGFGLGLARLFCFLGLSHQSSYFLHNLIFKPFNRHFQPHRTNFDWLTRDEKIVDAYAKDPLCGQVCTYGFFQALFEGLFRLYRPKILSRMPKNLPILMISGQEDPLSHGGKTVQELAGLYTRWAGLDPKVVLLPENRHEVLNEIDRQKTFEVVLEFLVKGRL